MLHPGSCGIHLAKDIVYQYWVVLMNLPENAMLAAVAVVLLLDSACADARPSDVLFISGAKATDRLHGPGHYLAQVKLKAKKSEVPGGGFIPPSVAAKRAQRAYGGKILAVRLRGTFYVVKLRGKGHVRKVRVNAITGRVVGP